jgi:hypothetical protein
VFHYPLELTNGGEPSDGLASADEAVNRANRQRSFRPVGDCSNQVSDHHGTHVAQTATITDAHVR